MLSTDSSLKSSSIICKIKTLASTGVEESSYPRSNIIRLSAYRMNINVEMKMADVSPIMELKMAAAQTSFFFLSSPPVKAGLHRYTSWYQTSLCSMVARKRVSSMPVMMMAIVVAWKLPRLQSIILRHRTR